MIGLYGLKEIHIELVFRLSMNSVGFLCLFFQIDFYNQGPDRSGFLSWLSHQMLYLYEMLVATSIRPGAVSRSLSCDLGVCNGDVAMETFSC